MSAAPKRHKAELFAINAAIDDREEQIAALTGEMRELRDDLNAKVGEYLLAIDDVDKRNEAARYIYWHVPRANATMLKRICPNMPTSGYVELCCSDCGIYYQHEVRNKQDHARVVKNLQRKGIRRDIPCCNTCKQARREARNALIAERKRREKEAYDLLKMPYDKYLMTPHWAQIRKDAHERAGNKCQLCASTKSLHVHHNTYDNRGNEAPDDVVVLCAACHAKFHGIEGTQ